MSHMTVLLQLPVNILKILICKYGWYYFEFLLDELIFLQLTLEEITIRPRKGLELQWYN